MRSTNDRLVIYIRYYISKPTIPTFVVEAESIRYHWSFTSYFSSFAGYLIGVNSILSVLGVIER